MGLPLVPVPPLGKTLGKFNLECEDISPEQRERRIGEFLQEAGLTLGIPDLRLEIYIDRRGMPLYHLCSRSINPMDDLRLVFGASYNDHTHGHRILDARLFVVREGVRIYTDPQALPIAALAIFSDMGIMGFNRVDRITPFKDWAAKMREHGISERVIRKVRYYLNKECLKVANQI